MERKGREREEVGGGREGREVVGGQKVGKNGWKSVIYPLTMYLLRIFSQECKEEGNPTARLWQLRLE